MFSFLKGILRKPPTASALVVAVAEGDVDGKLSSSSSSFWICSIVTSPYECPLYNLLSTATIFPLNNTFAVFPPPISAIICSATVLVILLACARAMHLPIRHASDSVLGTAYLSTLSVLVGLAAKPTREPISEQDARRARSTISSLVVLVMMIDLPSPEA